MANYEIRPLQMRMLDIITVLDKTLSEHKLHYGMFSGSLIGAVRHHGFIPWDDDMDVLMPRPDYEQFIQHSKEWLPGQYEFVCSENDPDYPLPFGKIQDAGTTLIERPYLRYLGGVYVDVFPLDAVPSNWFTRHWQYTRYEFYKQALYLVHRDPYKHGHGPSCWLPLLTRRLFSMQGLQKRIRHLLTKYDYNKCTLAADYTDGLRGVMKKEINGNYGPYIFEGRKLQGIKRYDEYLSQIYGDYMKVPDGDHQRQHNFFYLNMNMPYREYKGDF